MRQFMEAFDKELEKLAGIGSVEKAKGVAAMFRKLHSPERIASFRRTSAITGKELPLDVGEMRELNRRAYNAKRVAVGRKPNAMQQRMWEKKNFPGDVEPLPEFLKDYGLGR